jgi:hypothetical protein
VLEQILPVLERLKELIQICANVNCLEKRFSERLVRLRKYASIVPFPYKRNRELPVYVFNNFTSIQPYAQLQPPKDFS